MKKQDFVLKELPPHLSHGVTEEIKSVRTGQNNTQSYEHSNEGPVVFFIFSQYSWLAKTDVFMSLVNALLMCEGVNNSC